MSFAGLVGDKAPLNLDEMAKLNWIIKEYEKENVRLRDEGIVFKNTYEGILEHEKHREKERNDHLKLINSLKMQLVIEKKGSDGLTKKLGAQSMDLTLHREQHQGMIDEQIYSRRKIKEMDKQLNDDRSKRLKNMHENEVMRRSNIELTARCTRAEDGDRKAAQALLDKIQRLETATTLNESKQRTIEAQGEEMLELNVEVRENGLCCMFRDIFIGFYCCHVPSLLLY